MTDPSQRPTHSILGASSAERWLECPASIGLSSGVSSVTSSYAAEGTGAHALAERCLVEEAHPNTFIGDNFLSDLGPINVTGEMADAVMMYLTLCQTVGAQAKYREIEKQIDINTLWPKGDAPADMFGTADFTCWGTPDRRLSVVDFKYGKGVAVEVETRGVLNPQLMYYALGVVLNLTLGKLTSPIWVDIYICQPRADHPLGPIRKATISVIDLLAWGYEVLKPGAEACYSESPKAVVGDGCRWCPARGRCPALRQVAQETARVEFDSVPPGPNELSDAELGAILNKTEIIRAFVDGVRSEASGRLDRGGHVPGWKLVMKRGNRKWIDEAVVSGKLKDMGLPEDKVIVTKLRSPAQIEKILKKNTPEDISCLSDHIVKESSGTTLVRDLDPRQAAAAGPSADFDKID